MHNHAAPHSHRPNKINSRSRHQRFANTLRPFGSLAPTKLRPEAASSADPRNDYGHANEVAPNHNAATGLGVRSVIAFRFANCRDTDPLRTDPISRANRCALHFGWSWVLGCRVFQL